MFTPFVHTYLHLNTSNVTVNLDHVSSATLFGANLNTSNVTVNQKYFRINNLSDKI